MYDISAQIQQKVSSGLPEDSQGLASPTPLPLGCAFPGGTGERTVQPHVRPTYQKPPAG